VNLSPKKKKLYFRTNQASDVTCYASHSFGRHHFMVYNGTCVRSPGRGVYNWGPGLFKVGSRVRRLVYAPLPSHSLHLVSLFLI
ncbi:hypothetical protein GIB67_028576, partial [Kingdonia uniflora]